jgi:hypothetical protein
MLFSLNFQNLCCGECCSLALLASRGEKEHRIVCVTCVNALRTVKSGESPVSPNTSSFLSPTTGSSNNSIDLSNSMKAQKSGSKKEEKTSPSTSGTLRNKARSDLCSICKTTSQIPRRLCTECREVRKLIVIEVILIVWC